jgi:hypothetical protein
LLGQKVLSWPGQQTRPVQMMLERQNLRGQQTRLVQMMPGA